MKNREALIKTPEYWMENIQNEIFRQVNELMEKENINKTQLAEKLQCSKGYVSQILSGDYNFSIRKLVELSLAVDSAPIIDLEKIEHYIAKEESRLERISKTGTVVIKMNRYNEFSESNAA